MNPTYVYRMLIFIERVSELIWFSPEAHAGSVTWLANEFYACGFESFAYKLHICWCHFVDHTFRFYSFYCPNAH